MTKVVEVWLWGTRIGYLGYAPGERVFATFEYDSDFGKSDIQVSPLQVKYPPLIHEFRNLDPLAFHGLPGFIADSLPDRFGNRLIDLYMAEKGIPSNQVTALDRLLYVANRGMGALEYRPGEHLSLQRTALDLGKLAELAELSLQDRESLVKRVHSIEDRADALTLIRIGSSAGGARAKGIVALSSKGTVLDGSVNHGPAYTYWVVKFETQSNQDRDGRDPPGMPKVEYIYSIIAKNAGITIPRTQLITHEGEDHFLIERFDRVLRGGKLDKLHYLSWSGLDHADRDLPHSYEELILTMRRLGLGQEDLREMYHRAVFNIIGRNQDDHTKNTGFLMNRKGEWRLSPAFDLVYSYDPLGRWTRNHQTQLGGKRDDFNLKDLLEFGNHCGIEEPQARNIVQKVQSAFGEFSTHAKEHGVPEKLRETIEGNIRRLT